MNDKLQLIVAIGLPGSGKTTWAIEFCREHPEYIRVNKDDIRSMFCVDKRYTKDNEQVVFNSQLKILDTIFKSGYNVILDNTNLDPSTFKKLENLIHKYDINVQFHYFNIPLEECLNRNRNRSKIVPDDVIIKMYNKYIKNKTEEEIINNLKNKLSQNQIKHQPIIYKKYRKNDFTNAIIVDIDGTIADASNRNIYDLSKVITDIPRTQIIKIIDGYVNHYDDINIIVVSGRKSNSLVNTVQWLDKYFPMYNCLYMRNEKDNRCDSIVKEEIYLEYIKNEYKILAVFDDRQRVVDMWRKHNLNVLQVDEGDF